MADAQSVPVAARVHLAHAVLQAVADASGAEILHIKGPAIEPGLAGDRRTSVDADALIRPSHLSRFLGGLRVNGWSQVTPFLDRGLVQHSTVWFHPQLGQADLHYRYPGIGLAQEPAFDRLWQDHATTEIAHQPCTVPSLPAQRLILLLHAARDPHFHVGYGEPDHRDSRIVWPRERRNGRWLGKQVAVLGRRDYRGWRKPVGWTPSQGRNRHRRDQSRFAAHCRV